MTDRLTVRLYGDVVGSLERGARDGLAYRAIAGARGISVGATDGVAWTTERTRAWFEALLPEGEQRTRIAGRFGLSTSNSFGLLAEIGWECAGAVAVTPEGATIRTGAYRALTDAEVGQRLDALPARPFDTDGEVRVSLGGYQSNLVLAWRDGGWAEPTNGSPSTHLLKPEPEIWPGLAAAEAWAMTLAGHVTPAAAVRWDSALASAPTLVVTRFDRVLEGTAIRRRHQEDLTQLLGLLPEAKYAHPPLTPWMPSWRRMADTLLRRSVDPIQDQLALVRQMTVTIALANADAHAKNVAVVHEGGGLVSLAPMYDVVPTVVFVPRQVRSAMSIAGKFRMDEIAVEHPRRRGGVVGYPVGACRGDRPIDRARAA